MKIAHINENNQLLGWYSTDIHKEIPTPNIEVTEEQWQTAIDNGHNKVNEDGTTELFDFRTAEEIVEADKQDQIAQAKAYLNETDWIVTKIAESQALGADIAGLLTKYSVELAQREASRTTINELEGNS
jgi:hypothetical protein